MRSDTNLFYLNSDRDIQNSYLSIENKAWRSEKFAKSATV